MDMVAELKAFLNRTLISSQNIGNIRRQLFVPWNSDWNAIVRDETAARENLFPQGGGEVISEIKDPFKSDKPIEKKCAYCGAKLGHPDFNRYHACYIPPE